MTSTTCPLLALTNLYNYVYRSHYFHVHQKVGIGELKEDPYSGIGAGASGAAKAAPLFEERPCFKFIPCTKSYNSARRHLFKWENVFRISTSFFFFSICSTVSTLVLSTSSTPTAASTSTFAAPVSSAVESGPKAVAAVSVPLNSSTWPAINTWLPELRGSPPSSRTPAVQTSALAPYPSTSDTITYSSRLQGVLESRESSAEIC